MSMLGAHDWFRAQVWHTHLLYPQDYSEDCLRIGDRVFDHVQDSDDDGEGSKNGGDA